MADIHEHQDSGLRPSPGWMAPSGPGPVRPVGEVPEVSGLAPVNAGEPGPGTPPVVQFISIPPESRDLPVPERLPDSRRLRGFFKEQRVKTFGELHGLSFSTFLDLYGCGPITLLDLIDLIRKVGGRIEKVPEGQAPAWRAPDNLFTFDVPQSRRNLDPYTLPITARAESVLKQCGVKRLRDLETIEIKQIQRQKNCGRCTLREIEQILKRVGAGEFDVPPAAKLQPVDLLEGIDDILSLLPPQRRRILELRFGSPPESLGEIGAQLGMTREWVRQVIAKTLAQIAQRNPIRKAILRRIVKMQCKSASPLTPEIVRSWVPSRSPMRFTAEFYVRIIEAMMELEKAEN